MAYLTSGSLGVSVASGVLGGLGLSRTEKSRKLLQFSISAGFA